MKTWGIPKGRACSLHLTKEYEEGKLATTHINPYDYFNEYAKHYAWDIGHQSSEVYKEKMKKLLSR